MTPEQIQALVRGEISDRSKVSHAALLVVAIAMAIVVTSVWITEPILPARTHVAFGVLTVIALLWITHAIWVLTHKAILLVPHQVQAARLSMAACVVCLAGCLLAWLLVGGLASILATVSAAVMTGVSVYNFRRASERYRALMRRRDELLNSSETSGFSPTASAGLKPGCSEDKEPA
jgi:O-antigen/teichoic acid export membrane protein